MEDTAKKGTVEQFVLNSQKRNMPSTLIMCARLYVFPE